MQSRVLGRTGLEVSLLAFGAAPIANLYRSVSETQAIETVHAALAAGITYFDTAPLYGNGLSETRLGLALKGVPRDAIVLSTKVGQQAGANGKRQHDYSRDGVLRSLESSLKRLQTDRIDIVHIHDPDNHYREALDGAYPALDELRRQGVIRAVSAGMNQWQMLADFARAGAFDCFMLAGRYTLLEQGALPLLDLCAEKGIGILAAGVYNSGILAKGVGATYNYREAPPEIVEKTKALSAICARHDVPLATAALQFPLGHPAVASLVIGWSSVARTASNLAALTADLPPALWTDLRDAGLLDAAAPLPPSRQKNPS